MAPEDTRWSSANQALPNRGAWQAADGVMLSTGKKGERFHMNEDYALPNGFGAMDFGHVGIPDTGNIVKEVHIAPDFKLKLAESFLLQHKCLLSTGGEDIVSSSYA
jgi:hypothetical protein